MVKSFADLKAEKTKPTPEQLKEWTNKVLMSAHLYYDLSSPVLPDHEYDEMSRNLADNWDLLDEYSKWLLGDADGIRASGMGVKLTFDTVKNAAKWHKEVFGSEPEGYYNFADYAKESRYWATTFRTISG